MKKTKIKTLSTDSSQAMSFISLSLIFVLMVLFAILKRTHLGVLFFKF